MLDFVRQTRFDHLGVFTYSREEGTEAAGLRYHVPEKEKERRRETIMHDQMEISASINTSLIGSVQEVIIEGKSDRPDYPYIGRCRRQAPEIDGVTYIKGPSPDIGHIVKCRITAADDYDLLEKIIRKSSSPWILFFLFFCFSTADIIRTIRADSHGRLTALFRIWSRARPCLYCKGRDIPPAHCPYPKISFCRPPRTNGDGRSSPECPACFRLASGHNLPAAHKP